jgi:cell division protein FtsN
MNTKRNTMASPKMIVLVAATFITSLLVLTTAAAPEKKERAAKQEAQGTPQPGQKQFDTPKQAADALIQVAANFDPAAAKEILGPDSEDIVSSEDPVEDKNRATAFAEKAKEKNSIELDKKDPKRAILLVGNDDFPLPIPIVKRKGKWSFDTKVGREEILNRRIGANELNAIEICRGFVEAQHEYAQEKHDDSKVNQYAQRIISTPGKHDGLAWQNADSTWGGPVGEEVAKALEQGYSNPSQPQPYHGYYFKVLKGQGSAAPMGEMDFVVGGAMIGGFALAAAPAEYRVTGVQTFIVGPDGVVYEKDLGPDTVKTFQGMDRYNPDKTWKVTEDDVEDDSQE